MQCYRLLLLAAYGLATAHALVCIVSGDNSAGFCPWWPWPLTFELGQDFCTMNPTANFDCPTFSRSEVIMRTKNTLTNKQMLLKTSAALRYATLLGNKNQNWYKVAFYIHNQSLSVVDLLLITGQRLVNCDVMQLNIVTGQPEPKSGYGYRTQLNCRHSFLCFWLLWCVSLISQVHRSFSSCHIFIVTKGNKYISFDKYQYVGDSYVSMYLFLVYCTKFLLFAGSNINAVAYVLYSRFSVKKTCAIFVHFLQNVVNVLLLRLTH